MEALGAEGQWTSLSGVYTAEEADFMALLLNNQISPNGVATFQNFWPNIDHHQSNYHIANNYCSLDLSNPNHNNNNNINSTYSTFSRGSSTTSPRNNYSNEISDQNSQPTSIDFFLGDSKTATNNPNHSILVQQRDHCDDNNGLIKIAPKGIKRSESFASLEDHNKARNNSGVKRPRSYDNVEGVGKKQGKSKKKPKLVLSIPERRDANEELGNGFGANNGPSSSRSTCCSGDESINCGQDLSGGDDSLSLSPTEPFSDTKGRARRGSATDPQSLYARKRRERINERLRILQNLVPNGTKVDISTMLEEAVQYVKFLQIQIKLLSSDDLWMYAPIAYNGKELGLDHHLKLSLAKQDN